MDALVEKLSRRHVHSYRDSFLHAWSQYLMVALHGRVTSSLFFVFLPFLIVLKHHGPLPSGCQTSFVPPETCES